MNNFAKACLGESLNSFDDGVMKMFDEISLSATWHKPSYLVVVYRQLEERAISKETLAGCLSRDGYSICHIDAGQIGFATFREMVFADIEPEKTAYFVDNLNFDDHSSSQSFWQLFYEQRENFDEKLLKVVFWIPEKQFSNAAMKNHSYWENRYQVVDLTTNSDFPDGPGAVGVETEANFQPVGNSELNETLLTETNSNLEAGILDWRCGELESAYQYLRNALDLAEVLGDTTIQINCYKGLALVLTSMNNFNEAIDAYNKILELDSHSAMPWNCLGNLYSRIEDFEKADEAFATALAYDPTNVISWLGQAGVYEKNGMFQQSLDSYREALKIMPDLVLAWFRLGGVLEQLNQPQNAIRAYQILVNRSLHYVPAWVRMAKIYANRGDFAEAIKVTRKALEYSPSSFDLWMCLGNVARKFDNPLAIEAYRKALAINPRHGQAYCQLAHTHAGQGNTLDAISCYEIGINFLETDSERSGAFKNLMAVLEKTDKKHALLAAQVESCQAEKFLKQPQGILEVASVSLPVEKDAEKIPATVANVNDKYETASENLHRAPRVVGDIVEIPRRSEAHTESSRMHKSDLASEIYVPAWYRDKKKLTADLNITRKVSPAYSDYEQIKLLTDAALEQPVSDFWQPRKKNRQKLNLTQNHSTVVKQQEKPGSERYLPEDLLGAQVFRSPWKNDKVVRTWLRQGKHLLKHGVYNDAVEAFQNVINVDAECGTAYINMGIAYFFLGKYDRALVQFYKGLEFTSDESEKSLAWNHIGDTYRRLHDADNAMRAYQKVSQPQKADAVLRQRARRVLLFGNC